MTKRYLWWSVLVAFVAVLALVAAGCGSEKSSSGSGDQGSGDTSGSGGDASGLPKSIGPGEGQLNLIAWEGYTEDDWVKPFQKETGCKVNRKYGGSSDEMVTLMRQGGGGQYDLVSASGDASLRLIAGEDVLPINVELIPDWADFFEALQSPPHNTVDGKHYGVSYQWGPNTLLYNTKTVTSKPTTWGALYDEKYKGQITVPDNPIQIADAALYLSKTQPDLGIEDPYELTQEQFDAAIALLKKQAPLVKKYWALASDEIDLFKNGDVAIGASWPYQTNTLKADGVSVQDTIPEEGTTGWADTWMLSSKTKHPNCAYLWMKYASTPEVQAQVATFFGSTPANPKAASFMDPKAVKEYHVDAPESYFDQIRFWKTPVAECGDGSQDCVDYTQWQQAWTAEVRG